MASHGTDSTPHWPKYTGWLNMLQANADQVTPEVCVGRIDESPIQTRDTSGVAKGTLEKHIGSAGPALAPAILRSGWILFVKSLRCRYGRDSWGVLL